MEVKQPKFIPTLYFLEGTENAEGVKQAIELLDRTGWEYETQCVSCFVAAYSEDQWKYPTLYHPGLYKDGLEAIESFVQEYVPPVRTNGD